MTDYGGGGIRITSDDAYGHRPESYLKYENGSMGELGVEDAVQNGGRHYAQGRLKGASYQCFLAYPREYCRG